MKMLVAQSYLTHCDSMDCSPTGRSVHGISQARIQEWVAQETFPTQGSSQGILHYRWILYKATREIYAIIKLSLLQGLQETGCSDTSKIDIPFSRFILLQLIP